MHHGRWYDFIVPRAVVMRIHCDLNCEMSDSEIKLGDLTCSCCVQVCLIWMILQCQQLTNVQAKLFPNKKWFGVYKSIAWNLSQMHVETYLNAAVFDCFPWYIIYSIKWQCLLHHQFKVFTLPKYQRKTYICTIWSNCFVLYFSFHLVNMSKTFGRNRDGAWTKTIAFVWS